MARVKACRPETPVSDGGLEVDAEGVALEVGGWERLMRWTVRAAVAIIDALAGDVAVPPVWFCGREEARRAWEMGDGSEAGGGAGFFMSQKICG